MYTFNIIVKNVSAYEDVVHSIYTYLHMLTDTGQIIHKEHLLVQKNNCIEIAVACPEIHSLNDENCNQYGLQFKQKIEEGTGKKMTFIETGTEPDYPFPRYAINPRKSSFYILCYGWSSPLLCGDTMKPIPLYKIPYYDERHTDYSNIWQWERESQSLYRLWLGSRPTTENFAINELQEVHSEHNTFGRELCRIIEEKTGVPTYYFLYNFRSWTTKEDLERKCPITKNEWRIEGKTSADFYAFKCDESRLISELSTNCRDE